MTTDFHGTGPAAALPHCPNCSTPIGGHHELSCKVARCLATGRLRFACAGSHNSWVGNFLVGCGRQMWTGYRPGTAEAAELGFDPVSSEKRRCAWDQVARRWRKAPVMFVDDTAYVQWHLDRGVPVPAGAYKIGDNCVLIPGDYLERAIVAGRDPGSVGYPLSEPGDPAILVLAVPRGGDIPPLTLALALSRGEYTIALTGYADTTLTAKPRSGEPGIRVGADGVNDARLMWRGFIA
jgi:hypothetical protein